MVVCRPIGGPETSVAASESEVPTALRKVYRRLERWRSNRKGRSRIPESLWAAAGELAREHGVNPVSRMLRLEFNHLKRLAESSGQTARKRRAMPAFVELIAPQSAVAPACAIELQGRRGTMRIEWKGTTTDLVRFHQQAAESLSQRGAGLSADSEVSRLPNTVMKKKDSRRRID